jgi:glycerophosphoryl diester phosphodiesterase
MWPYPRIIAHRGGGTLAPENTLAAMRCGMDHGYRAVEFDVMLAADGVPVLMHDPHFGRTILGNGSVPDTPSAALATLDAGSWFGAGVAGEPVPLFKEVVRFCRDNGIWMNIEIKPAPGFEAETGRAVAEATQGLFSDVMAAGSDPRALPLFSSFSFDALMAAMQAAPGIPRGFLVGELPSDWRARLDQLQAVALHANHKKLTQEQARQVKQAGFGLFCYTVNEPERARAILGWGVDAFCTDRIDLIPADFA